MSKINLSEKQKNLIITICTILAILLVVGLAVYNRVAESGILLRNQVAVESENFEVNGLMMSYFMNSNIQPYSAYFSYFGVDTSKSLKDQMYSEEQTWFEYFTEATETYLSEILTLCEYGKANGVELDEEALATIDETLSDLAKTAKTYGYTTDTYLKLSFGSGMTEKDVRACLELTTLADLAYTAYTDSIDYTDEELSAYREANPDSFNGIDYIKFTTYAKDFTIFGEDDIATSTAEEDNAAAKAAAEAIAAGTTAEEVKALIVDYLNNHHDEHEGHNELENEETAENAYVRHAIKSDFEEELAKWAFDAKVGDTKIEPNEKGTEFTVYFIAKTAYVDESATRSVRHILFTSETYEDDTKAKEIYAEWEAAEFSDEKFIELEYKYNEDEGSKADAGEYKNIALGQTTAAFEEWLFADERKVGDHDLVKSDYGWHIMEYLGEGDSVAWKIFADQFKSSDDYKAFIEAGKEKISFNDKVINSLDY